MKRCEYDASYLVLYKVVGKDWVSACCIVARTAGYTFESKLPVLSSPAFARAAVPEFLVASFDFVPPNSMLAALPITDPVPETASGRLPPVLRRSLLLWFIMEKSELEPGERPPPSVEGEEPRCGR